MHIGLPLKYNKGLCDCVLKESSRSQKDETGCKDCKQTLINRNASGTEHRIPNKSRNQLVRAKGYLQRTDKLEIQLKSSE